MYSRSAIGHERDHLVLLAGGTGELSLERGMALKRSSPTATSRVVPDVAAKPPNVARRLVSNDDTGNAGSEVRFLDCHQRPAVRTLAR